MKSLLLVAHGSRRKESNEEVAKLADVIKQKTHQQFANIKHAFLELAEPSIEDAVDDLVNAGAKQIVVLPYFLSAGRHVHEDVPEIINAKRAQYADLDLIMAPYLGESNEIPDVLISLAVNPN
jgi:sirohydrochlorin ferrochelatase